VLSPLPGRQANDPHGDAGSVRDAGFGRALGRERDRRFVGLMSETFGGEAIPAVPRLHGCFRLGMHARIDVS